MHLQDIIPAGSTSYVGARLRIIDDTDGVPLTTVVYNSAGLDLWYQRPGATRTAITEASLATVDAAYSSGGFIHVSDGSYRLDLPNAALAAGVSYVDFGGTVTGGIIIGGRIKLTAGFSFADTVRAGLTALPNAAADAAGGLIISDTGGLDVDDLKADVTAILQDTGTDGVIVAALTAAADEDVENAVWDAMRVDHPDVGSYGDVQELADLVAGVWNELLAGYTISGSAGLALSTAAVGGIDYGTLASAVWGVSLPGAYTAGTAGYRIGTHIDASISVVDLVVDTIQQIVGIDGVVVAESSKTDYSLSVAAQTAVADVFLNRDLALGVDSGSPTVRTVRQALRFLRNAWNMADTTLTVYKEDDTTPSWTSVLTTSPAASLVTGVNPAS